MKEQLRKIVREIMRERAISEMNEARYNYKADALTAYFKGKIDAEELDRIARDDFKSSIATKKELSNFLSNKFTQDVMSDTYGIRPGVLIKRVRGLMKFAEGIGESVNEAKSITLITYGGKKSKYSNSDISRFIGKLDLSSEDLPGFIYKASMGNSNIIGTSAKSYNKKKEAILKLLKKIKSHGGDVIIDVDSKKPSYKQSIKFESVINEGYSTEEKRIVMMAVRKLSKYRNVPIDQSINDLLGAGAELQRDIKKGKIKK
jgi:hypothetical protein